MLALDMPDRRAAESVLSDLEGEVEWIKIGLQMYLACGGDFVRQTASRGFKIFLDLKLYDIPNTVASAIKSLANLPISMLTIHASGGREMMESALAAARESNPDLLLLGVTVLTSFDGDSLALTGVGRTPAEQVRILAKLAVDSGMRGLVCSPLEIEMLRKIIPAEVKLVTPGIRPAGADSNEQKRVMTPMMAKRAGADFIVVGRPILRAENPAAAARAIKEEIS